MKGPLVFFASLVAVAVLGVVVVLPRLTTEAPADLPAPLEDARYDAARRLLAEGLGLVDGPRERAYDDFFGALGNDFSMVRRPSTGAREGVLTVPWDRLAELIQRVPVTRAPVLESLAVSAAPGEDGCQVTLRFHPLPEGLTVP